MKVPGLLFGLWLVACQGDREPSVAPAPRAWLVLKLPPSGVDPKTLRVEPSSSVVTSSRRGSQIVLGVRSGGDRGELQVEIEHACPVSVPMAELSAGAVVEHELSPWLDFGGPHVGVGFDELLTINVVPGCAEAQAGRIDWRQSRGASGAPLESEARGFRLEVRTPRPEQVLDRDLPWGIVPISPRTRGSMLLEAVWRGPRPRGGARSLRFEVEVSAAFRSRGLPNVALGTSLLLANEGWRLRDAPPGARAELRSASGFTAFQPDRHGRWLLEDRDQRTLSIHAARLDHTPLDCGRADCHASIAAAVSESPMTSILKRELERGTPGYPACALGCHTLGEQGAKDGGFSHVAAEIGIHTGALPSGAGSWDELPRALRRLGGVGCLACHGPGAIPEPEARFAILRSDVCAYCHDAPPRYGHVAAWRSSAMARADRDPRASSDDRCVRCHTTSGFLADQGARSVVHTRLEPAPRQEPIGIGCAGCHAVHNPNPAAGTRPALLRPVRMPTLLADQPVDPKSRVCTPCHTPSVDEGAPAASAAAVLFGRGGADPSSGAALEGPAPHARIDGGCLACHGTGPSGLERGAAHAFAARRDACRRCHPAAGDGAGKELQRRATTLLARLLPRGHERALDSERPPHATLGPLNTKTPRGRALRNVLLVVEDPAAAEHNLPYARKLLEASELWLRSP